MISSLLYSILKITRVSLSCLELRSEFCCSNAVTLIFIGVSFWFSLIYWFSSYIYISWFMSEPIILLLSLVLPSKSKLFIWINQIWIICSCGLVVSSFICSSCFCTCLGYCTSPCRHLQFFSTLVNLFSLILLCSVWKRLSLLGEKILPLLVLSVQLWDVLGPFSVCVCASEREREREREGAGIVWQSEVGWS